MLNFKGTLQSKELKNIIYSQKANLEIDKMILTYREIILVDS